MKTHRDIEGEIKKSFLFGRIITISLFSDCISGLSFGDGSGTRDRD